MAFSKSNLGRVPSWLHGGIRSPAPVYVCSKAFWASTRVVNYCEYFKGENFTVPKIQGILDVRNDNINQALRSSDMREDLSNWTKFLRDSDFQKDGSSLFFSITWLLLSFYTDVINGCSFLSPLFDFHCVYLKEGYSYMPACPVELTGSNVY